MNSYKEDIAQIARDSDPIQAIWNIAKDWQYGIHDDRIDGMQDSSILDNPGGLKWRILTPQEVLERKYGVCWDQCLCLSYLATQANLRYNFIYESQTCFNSHTICFLEHNKRWWYLESSWGQHKGLHGPYKTEMDGLRDFCDMMFKMSGHGFLYLKTNIDVAKLWHNKHISMRVFIAAMGITIPKWDALCTVNGVMKNSSKVDYDSFHRVTRIHYRDGSSRNWDASKGEYA